MSKGGTIGSIVRGRRYRRGILWCGRNRLLQRNEIQWTRRRSWSGMCSLCYYYYAIVITVAPKCPLFPAGLLRMFASRHQFYCQTQCTTLIQPSTTYFRDA